MCKSILYLPHDKRYRIREVMVINIHANKAGSSIM